MKVLISQHIPAMGAGVESAGVLPHLGTISYTDPETASSDVGNKLVINDIRAGLAFKFGGAIDSFTHRLPVKQKPQPNAWGFFSWADGEFQENARSSRVFRCDNATTQTFGCGTRVTSWRHGGAEVARHFRMFGCVAP